jgi:uncharacterized protein YwgA
MKLTETIERCEKLVLEEIDGCEHYLVWYESSISDTEESRREIQKINERKNELLEDLNNLRFIKYESNLLDKEKIMEVAKEIRTCLEDQY